MSIKLQREYQITIYPPQYLQTAPIVSDTAPYSGSAAANTTGLTFDQLLPGDFYFTPPVSNVGIITIQNPFTMIMNISRQALAPSANTGNFQIYNLSETVRSQLYVDYSDWLCFRRITVKAGYESTGNVSVIFDGKILWSNSYRKQGTTNYITEIEALDGGFAMVNAFTTKNFNGIVTKNQVVAQLINDMCAMGPSGQQLTPGYIHNYVDNNGNPITEYYRSISEYSWKQLQYETGGSCYIDNGQINVLGNGECFNSIFTQLDQSTGLLGSPKRSNAYVIAEMLFEPSIVVGQQINLATEEPNFQGTYIVYMVTHSGIISDSIGGRLQTTVTMYSPGQNLKLLQLSGHGLGVPQTA